MEQIESESRRTNYINFGNVFVVSLCVQSRIIWCIEKYNASFSSTAWASSSHVNRAHFSANVCICAGCATVCVCARSEHAMQCNCMRRWPLLHCNIVYVYGPQRDSERTQNICIYFVIPALWSSAYSSDSSDTQHGTARHSTQNREQR